MGIIVPGSLDAAPAGAVVQQAQMAAESALTWAVRVLLTGVLFVTMAIREADSGDRCTSEEEKLRRSMGKAPAPGPFRLSFGRAKEVLETAAIWSGLIIDCTIAEVRARMAQAAADQQRPQ